MKKLVLIGGGGHCKSILDSLMSGVLEFDDIDLVITDALSSPGSDIYGYKIVGGDELLPSLFKQGYEYAFISVGSVTDTSLREKLVNKAKEIGFKFITIIDPSARVSRHASIGEGTFVSKGAIINADCSIGNHCIINSGTIIEHGCSVGDFAHISSGSTICGDVSIGQKTLVGAGSVVIQNIHIGNKAVIGARSVVIGDVEDGVTKYGVIS